jgi:antitoxin ParD1/3/4
MTMLNISLPESMQAFIEAQTAARGLNNPSDYVQELIREAQRTHEQAELEARLLSRLEALERGEGREMTSDDWEALKARLRMHHKQGNGH